MQNLKADNYALVEELKKQVLSTEERMSAIVESEINFHKEITDEVKYVASSTGLQTREAAKTAIAEAVEHRHTKRLSKVFLGDAYTLVCSIDSDNVFASAVK